MEIHEPHPWDLTPAEARRLQADLRHQVDLTDAVTLPGLTSVAGVDNAYVRAGDQTVAHAVAVRLAVPDLTLLEAAHVTAPVTFPYVPGLLSFREAPAILAALRQLSGEPDVVLFDGQGIAHPRRFGLAAHLGIVLGRPAIGCAKSRLTGAYDEPADTAGAHTPLVDRGEVIGVAVRTRPGHAPLFVSPGHRVSVDTAIAIVLACCRPGQFLPEPTRLAHASVTAAATTHRRALTRP